MQLLEKTSGFHVTNLMLKLFLDENRYTAPSDLAKTARVPAVHLLVFTASLFIIDLSNHTHTHTNRGRERERASEREEIPG